MSDKEWFVAHRTGLRQLHERIVERRGFGIIGGELYQNCMDTTAKECNFTITKLPGRPAIQVVVEDDGEGFQDLSHAWTIFAPSFKKSDPTKAGRFNLGEKVVLSFAEEAKLETTTGTVIFNEKDGRQTFPRRKREKGTVFNAILRCNEERYQQLLAYMQYIIVRPGLKLYVNGLEVAHRWPIHSFETVLATEVGENLSPTRRNTTVEVYEPVGGVAMLYELGIPVVETEDKWSYSIGQKVPLNSDRDNVTPAFLRSVRVAVMNEMHDRLEPVDTETPWVNEATSDPNCTDQAAETFRQQKYGKKSVSLDPTNPEANAEAFSHGYTVIPSRGLTAGQRDNLKRAGTLQSSSSAFPTAGKGAYSDDPNATPVEVIPFAEWTDGMKLIHDYTVGLGERLLGKLVCVEFVRCDSFVGKPWSACYGRGHLLGISSFHYNVFKLGKKWFDNGVTERQDRLIIHEFGHQFESNHLCEEYYDALCDLGAKLKAEALKDPEWFRCFQKKGM